MTEITVPKMHLVCTHCNATNRVPADKLQAELNCGQCHASLLSVHPDNLGEAAFNAQIAKSDLPVVVDFWAPWCGPCRMMAPAYEKVSQDMQGHARFVKVNTEVEQGLADLEVSSSKNDDFGWDRYFCFKIYRCILWM